MSSVPPIALSIWGPVAVKRVAELLPAVRQGIFGTAPKALRESSFRWNEGGIDSCFKSGSGRLSGFKTFKTRNELVRLVSVSGGIGSCGWQAFRKDGTVFRLCGSTFVEEIFGRAFKRNNWVIFFCHYYPFGRGI